MTEHRVRAILEEALQLRQSGDLTGALERVRPLLKQAPKSPAQAALIATLYWEAEQWKEAARWFGEAARLNPDSERASLGLFHALWAADRRLEALSEMARFRAKHRSGEYDTLHRELTQELLEYMAYMNGTKASHSRPAWRGGKKRALR